MSSEPDVCCYCGIPEDLFIMNGRRMHVGCWRLKLLAEKDFVTVAGTEQLARIEVLRGTTAFIKLSRYGPLSVVALDDLEKATDEQRAICEKLFEGE